MSDTLRWDLYGNDHMSATLEKLAKNVDGFGRKLDSATSGAQRMGRQLDHTDVSVGRLDKRMQDTSRSTTTLRDRMSSVAGFAMRMGTTVATAGAAAATGILAAAGALGFMGVQAAAANESAALTFKVLLGSGEKAAKFMKDLQKFAASTPFDMPSLREAASRLLAVGVTTKDIIPLLTRLGDATSGMGTGAFGIQRAVYALQQMKQAGKVSLEDINQLTDAGIPALDALASKLGITVMKVREQITAGKIKPEQLFDALLSGAGKSMKRLDGMMTQQATTLEGKWSTFKDNLGQSLATMMEPAIPGMKKVLDWVSEAIPAAVADIKGKVGQIKNIFSDSPVPQRIVDALKKLGDEIMPKLRDSWSKIVKTIQDNKEGLEKFGRFLADVAIPLLGIWLMGTIDNVVRVLQGLIIVTANVTDAVVWMARRITDILGILIDGMASTFGWLPFGIGDSLKKAAVEFEKFAKRVNAALDSINGDVTAKVTISHEGGMKASAGVKKGSSEPGTGRQGGAFSDGGWASGRIRVGEHGPEELDLGGRSAYVHSRESLQDGGDFTVTQPAVFNLEGFNVWQGMLRVKRRRGIVSMGLA